MKQIKILTTKILRRASFNCQPSTNYLIVRIALVDFNDIMMK